MDPYLIVYFFNYFTAKLEGEQFFERFPRLCQIIASLCTISCVTSLMTIAMMSLNRYVFVCQKEYYRKIFSKKNCVIISVSLYSVGLTLVLLNLTGIGDHSFDRKSLECIWDRMASYSFTVVFSVTLVWIPCLVIGICYLRMYLFVRQHSRKMAEAFNAQKTISQKQPTMRRLKLQVFKSMFIIYVVFIICWAPYALIMVIDINNTFSHEAHIYITAFAHLHPSINWLVYFNTQKKFALAFRQILSCTWGKVSHPTSDLSEKSDSTIYRISMIDKAAGLSAIARDIRLNHRRPDSFSMSETVEECQAAESNTVAIIPTFDEKGQCFQSISVAQQNAVNETDKGADAASNSPVRRNIYGAKDLGFVLASTNRRSISEKGQAPKGFVSHHENMPV